MTKHIFNWNHISPNLTQDQITELKEYYQTYHKKCWAFKQAAKRFKKWKLLGDTLSVVFATGGIASAIATSGISLVAISTTSVIIQGWMKHKNLELKIQNCTYAYQSYQHLLNAIKDMMRGGDLQLNILHTMMNNIDNHSFKFKFSLTMIPFIQSLTMIPFIISPINIIIFSQYS